MTLATYVVSRWPGHIHIQTKFYFLPGALATDASTLEPPWHLPAPCQSRKPPEAVQGPEYRLGISCDQSNRANARLALLGIRGTGCKPPDALHRRLL